MANKAISDYSAITSLADDDLVLAQDVSDTTDNATGTYKKITAANVKSGLATSTDLSTHTSDTSNPHSVTADQVAPSQTGNNGKYLTTDGTNVSWGTVSGTGDVTGPASSTLNHIPQFSDTTGKVLKDGLAVTTTLGSPGADTNLPTEKAVRAAISAAGGGDVSGPASSTNLDIAVFSGTSGKLLEDGGATIASLVPTTRTVNSKALSSNITLSAADVSAVPTTRTVNSKALSADVTLTTADVADSTDKRYCTDAQKTVIGNTSGTNTGDVAKAAGSDVTTGTDDTKYVTSKAIKDAGITADLTYVSPSSDHSGSGIKTSITAGETTTIGQVAYIKSDGKAWLAKADATTTMPACVIALGSYTANSAYSYLVRGIVRDDSWTWTVGGLLYVSAATGGALTQTAPTGTGKQVQVVGVALSATTIMFMPNMMLLELA